MPRSLLFACLALLLCATAAAAPAAWQLWRSKSDGTTVCAQVSPGAGWERADGPYRDARCTQRGKPGA
jgi:hypothetical protein